MEGREEGKISGEAFKAKPDVRVCRIWLPELARASKKQGKLRSDAGAPRAALYSCMRKRGKPADGLRSPKHFST